MKRWRNYLMVVLFGALGAGTFFGCSLSPVGGSSDHPVPTTPGIIPLQNGNQWRYRYTTFDSTGENAGFPVRELRLAITGIYRFHPDSGLLPVHRYEQYRSSERFVYRYEWESLDSGYLVYHQGTGSVNARGLYIAGLFRGEETVLFDTAHLWYAYPAGDTVMWEIVLPGGAAHTSVIELITSNEKSWFSQSHDTASSPLIFISGCYRYRQTVGEWVYYHTFHPEYGKISMRGYRSGILRESYVLIDDDLFH
jgi:hypothetical protein